MRRHEAAQGAKARRRTARRKGPKTSIARETTADLRAQLNLRTRERDEALEQQTATADVLKVISRSAFDLQSVLDDLLASACRLCKADIGTIRYADGNNYRLAATYGCKPEWIEHFSGYSTKPDRSSIFGQTIIGGHTVHMPDVLADPDYKRPAAIKLMGFRAALGVPLVREGHTFGVITLLRFAVGSFEPKQIELVATFADQAVIAIENVRLFEKVRARTHELTESLQQQTASADVLKVISASPGELEPVFQAMLENAVRLCEAKFAMLFLYEEEKNEFRAVGKWNLPPAWSEFLGKNTIRPRPMSPLFRAAITKQPVQVADVLVDQSYIERYPGWSPSPNSEAPGRSCRFLC
jgi:two-component system NtrC family sensor kinase